MEKSIEEIWKRGFSEEDKLQAPRVSNLHEQKSIHIVDKFKRMFQINLIAIVVFSMAFLVASYFMGILVMGSIYFVVLTLLVVINLHLLRSLREIDTSANCYQYLHEFNNWISKQIAINKKVASLLYPSIFLSIVLGLWFKDTEGMPLGERVVSEFLLRFPDMQLVLGVPLVGLLAVGFIVVLLAFFGGRIYLWDLNLVYGRILRKLRVLLADIERMDA